MLLGSFLCKETKDNYAMNWIIILLKKKTNLNLTILSWLVEEQPTMLSAIYKFHEKTNL